MWNIAAEPTEYDRKAVEFVKSVELEAISSLKEPGLYFSSNVLAEKAKSGYQRYQIEAKSKPSSDKKQKTKKKKRKNRLYPKEGGISC